MKDRKKKHSPRQNEELQPYIPGQTSDNPPEHDETAECAICHSLKEAAMALIRISNNIAMSCIGTSRKKDFGLEKSFVDSQIANLKRMTKFHQYYDATGSSLNDGDFGIQSGNENNSPPKFRRFRPQ